MRIWTAYLIAEPAPETSAKSWKPLVDIYRRGSEWLLKFDLAGVRPEDVQIQIAGRRIRVSGVRRDWSVDQGYSYQQMEISYNRFERTIELPADLSQAGYRLEARDGLLLVHVNV